MKNFVFYTNEGYTESPTGKTVENIQLLGFENGVNEKQAKEKLVNRCKWIEEKGFDKDKIQSKPLLDEELKELIKKLVKYNWDSEKKHYEEDPNSNHIFLVLKQIKILID